MLLVDKGKWFTYDEKQQQIKEGEKSRVKK